MGALAREQDRHRAAISDRRILVDDRALPGADHDDAASHPPPMILRPPQRFRMQRRGGIDLFRCVRGGGHDGFSFTHRHCEPTGRANARPMTGSAKQSSFGRQTLLSYRTASAPTGSACARGTPRRRASSSAVGQESAGRPYLICIAFTALRLSWPITPSTLPTL